MDNKSFLSKLRAGLQGDVPREETTLPDDIFTTKAVKTPKVKKTTTSKKKAIIPVVYRTFNEGDRVISINPASYPEHYKLDYRAPQVVVKTKWSEAIQNLQIIFFKGDDENPHPATDFKPYETVTS